MDNCGISKNLASDNKIINGRFALPGEFPWQLSLQVNPVPLVRRYRHICGAIVINNNWAMTAAHCVAGLSFASSFRVVAGSLNISEDGRADLPTSHRVVPIVHERYVPLVAYQYDIALLRLSNPMNIKESDGYINGVCLPSKDLADNVTGMGTISGWGRTTEGGDISENLQAVDVPFISDAECKKVYDRQFDESMVCAGYEEGGKDSCQGDSGGPLVQRSNDGVATLIGIVSFGRGCGEPKYPGVYTEVAHYIDWITRTMKTFGNGS